MKPTKEETSSLRGSISSIPSKIGGVGLGSMSSLSSLVSAITLEDESSAADNAPSRTTGTASRGHSFRNMMTTTHRSRDNLGKFNLGLSSSDLRGSSRFSPQPLSPASRKASKQNIGTTSKLISSLPLAMPTRKASDNYLGLNMPMRKASLYNIGSEKNIHNATFQKHLPSSISKNAKFDLTAEKLDSKIHFFPQSPETSWLVFPNSPPLDLSNEDIFKVVSPVPSVTKPKISKETMSGIKNILGNCKKSPTSSSTSPRLPQRKPSVDANHDDLFQT